MKIEYRQGDLLESGSCNVIAHGCNAQGVMGSGIAKQIRERYPKAYTAYRKEYEERGLFLGDIVSVFIPEQKIWILDCITQQNYGRDGKLYVDYGAIRTCMQKINMFLYAPCCRLPRIGAGLAGGDWGIIETIIEEEMTRVKPIVYTLP